MEINLVQDSTFQEKMTELIGAVEELQRIWHPHYSETFDNLEMEGVVSYDIE